MKTRQTSQKVNPVDLSRLKDRIKDLEQKEAELKLALETSQKTSEQYFDLIEKANDIIYETDADGHFTFVNQATEKIAGYSKEDLLGQHYLELIFPDYREEATRNYGKQFTYKIPDTYFELPLISKLGLRIWVGQHVQLLMHGHKVTGFQAVARDITKQKQIEEALPDCEIER